MGFTDTEAWVVLIGPHKDSDPDIDVYSMLYKLVGTNQKLMRRNKPPCCGQDGRAANLSQADVDELVTASRRLLRRR